MTVNIAVEAAQGAADFSIEVVLSLLDRSKLAFLAHKTEYPTGIFANPSGSRAQASTWNTASG